MSEAQLGPSAPYRYIYKIIPGTPSLPIIKNSTNDHSTSSLEPNYTVPSSALDKSSGYMHMSTSTQVPATLGRFFTSGLGQRSTVYVCRVLYADITTAAGSISSGLDVRWERPDGSSGVPGSEDVFPHIYLNQEQGQGQGVNGDGLPVLAGAEVERSGVVHVDSVVTVVSKEDEDGWEAAMGRVEGWLV